MQCISFFPIQKMLKAYNFKELVGGHGRYLVLRKKFFDFSMTRLKCFQCHLVHKICQEVRQLVSRMDNLFTGGQ
eukprot:UN09862